MPTVVTSAWRADEAITVLEGRCREGDSNPHGLPRRILSAMRLPFRHPGEGEDG